VNILFIYPVPAPDRKVYTAFSQGVGVLSAVLKSAGHTTSLYSAFRFDEADVRRRLQAEQPDLIAVSATSNQMPLAQKMMAVAGSVLPEAPIVVGGIHPTVEPEEVIALDRVCAICRGEGEQALLEVVRALEQGTEPRDIPNLWLKNGGQITRNEIGPWADLDALPFPDREIFDFQQILDRHGSTVGAELMASRGCPFACTYCVNPVLNRLKKGKGPVVRWRSVGHVVAEIDEIVGEYSGVQLLGFHDDVFTLNSEWLSEFCDEYPRRFRIPFWCNSRVDALNEQAVLMLRRAGCRRVHLGVEAGNERLRREVLRRNISDEQIRDAFALVKKHGMRAVSFNMVGIPYETEDTLKETIELNRQLKPHWLLVSIFNPMPGTALYDLCEREGWLRSRPIESFYDPTSAINQPSISREKVAWYYEHFVELARR